MAKLPLVSVIVPTKNSQEFLEACLKSICAQTYKNMELIVVDNFSTDTTPQIAQQYADKFYQVGPERSAQRNYGVKQSTGKYVAIIDSDMTLSDTVVADCIEQMKDVSVAGVIIPEESFGEGFWAQCKKLERSFYVGVDWMEAARFFERETYLSQGGYNEALISGEDWDLSNRMRATGPIRRINSYIFHNEGKISLLKTLRKKSFYAGHIGKYVEANNTQTSTNSEVGKVFKRFGLYFSRPGKLFRNPLVGTGMLFMKVCEFGWGAFGYLVGKRP